MRMQNAVRTWILYNGIYFKTYPFIFSVTRQKSISSKSTKTYCLHAAFTDDRRHAHYILTYMVQGQ